MSADGITGPEATPQFSIGDRVDLLGAQGVIARLYGRTSWLYPEWGIEVLTDSGRRFMLTPDGRLYPEMPQVVIKVIGRAKRKVKKWKWVYADKYGKPYITSSYFPEHEAETHGYAIKIEFDSIEVEE